MHFSKLWKLVFEMEEQTQPSSSRPTSTRFSAFGRGGPTLALEHGLDLNEIMKPGSAGAEIEFSTDGLEDEMEGMNIESNKLYFEGMNNMTHMFDNDSSDEDETKALNWFNRMKLKMQTDITEDGGVKKFVRKEGVGIVVPPGSRIRAHYDGYLEDLDEPFDSSRLRKRELQATLGKSQILQGLEIAISSMRQNEVARFLVAPDYAYGEMGCPPRIPAGADIIFEVELLSFTDSSVLDEYEEMSADDRRDLPFAKIINVAKTCNTVGNDLFGREMYGKAIRKYLCAINTLEGANLKNGDEEEQLIAICVKAYLNMALCYLKNGNFGKAVAAGKRVLEWKHELPKALYICGKSLRHLGSFAASRKFLLRAYKAAPRSKDVAEELKTLDEMEMKCKAVEKDMYKKMFAS